MPDEVTTVTTNPCDPTDVVIEIRDAVYVKTSNSEPA